MNNSNPVVDEVMILNNHASAEMVQKDIDYIDHPNGREQGILQTFNDG